MKALISKGFSGLFLSLTSALFLQQVVSCSPVGDWHGENYAETESAALAGEWLNWSETAFAVAEKHSRLLFMFMAPKWCAPCLRMESEALTHPVVDSLLRGSFLKLYISPEDRPDIADRYQFGGYPACIIMVPDGRMIGGCGSVPGDSLAELLRRTSETWKNRRPAALAQASKLDSLFLLARTPSQSAKPTDALLTRVEATIYSQYDSTYGGFGNQPKFLLPEILRFMLQGRTAEGEMRFGGELKQTFEAQMKLVDPEWGGFYQYARFADWSSPSYEKLLQLNARMLDLHLDAYLITGNEGYREVCFKIIRYIDGFLRSHRGWGFSNSQAAVGKGGDGSELPDDYFDLNAEQRLAHGIPAIDSAVYAESNAMAARGYLRAGRSLGREDLTEYALMTIDSLSLKAVDDRGYVLHRIDGASFPKGLLTDQVALGITLLDAYETTGHIGYLDKCELIAGFIAEHLKETARDGFLFDRIEGDRAGYMRVAVRPYEANAEAVILFARLFYLTRNDAYRAPAESALNFLAGVHWRTNDLRICNVGTAYLYVSRAPTMLVIVGQRSADYDSLLAQVWRHYYPRLSLRHLEPGRDELKIGRWAFGVIDRPVVYVCKPDGTSEPVDNPASLHNTILRLTTPQSTGE